MDESRMTPESVMKKIMPHSNEAEQAVIGSMIMSADAIPLASEKLVGEDFYNMQYRALFNVMVKLYNDNKNVDLVTIMDKLAEKDEANGTNFSAASITMDTIKEITSMVPTSANVREYADIVYRKSILRKMIKANEEIENICYADEKPLDEVLENAEKRVFDIVQSGNSGEYVPMSRIMLNVFDRISEAAKNKGQVTGIATGYKKLDLQLSGLQKSDLILIAARPSVGKTAFALNIVERVSVNNHIPTVIFSLEMSSEQLGNRLLSQHSMVSSQDIRNGNLSDDEWSSIVDSAQKISEAPIIVDDTPGMTISEMRSKCRKYKMEENIQLVIVDYLQLMASKERHASREQEIAEISRTLKAIARELNVPVIALSQLNRSSEAREDKKPQLSDLRESGSIEQDADVVMLMSRLYDRETKSEDRNRIIVNVAKQRNGPVGEIQLVWLPQYTKFEDAEEERV